MSSLFLSDFLKKKREEGWTQVKLAELLGITQVHVSRLMRGATPSIEIIIKLADHFGVTTDEILGRKKQKNGKTNGNSKNDEITPML